MFEAGIIQYLIVCPLVFLGGFVDSIAGGGGLISLPAYIIAGFPAHAAIGTNKLSSSMGTALTVFRFGRAGYIPWKPALFCVVAALAGGSLGARLTLLVSDSYLKLLMVIVLPCIAAYLIFGKGLAREKEPFGQVKTIVIGMVVAFAIGVYDGFYGPGTGTFLILLLCAAAHMPLIKSNGVAKAINLATNVSSLVVFWANGVVFVAFGLVAGLFGIAGNYVGSRLFISDGARIAKPIMLVVIAVFFVRVVLELTGVLG